MVANMYATEPLTGDEMFAADYQLLSTNMTPTICHTERRAHVIPSADLITVARPLH